MNRCYLILSNVCGGGIRKLRDEEMRKMFLFYSKNFPSVDTSKLFKLCKVFFGRAYSFNCG